MNEYRCTRRIPYSAGCPGHTDIGARQGYYLQADNVEDALKMMQTKFPFDGTEFDFQLWREGRFHVMSKTSLTV